MYHLSCEVRSLERIAADVFALRIHAPAIASQVVPGQFLNIRVDDSYLPLLRRPFSVYRTAGEDVEVIFNVLGLGTRILSRKRKGDVLDVLGPLGHGFTLDDDFTTAVLVGGGLGAAPLPLLTSDLRGRRKTIRTFIGARTRDQLLTAHLDNVRTATDDGSNGFHGTVVDLAQRNLAELPCEQPKIFGCGPNQMLRSLSRFAQSMNIPCEVSLESAMACGIGLCQGCPVEVKDEEKKFVLLCTEGPVINAARLCLD